MRTAWLPCSFDSQHGHSLTVRTPCTTVSWRPSRELTRLRIVLTSIGEINHENLVRSFSLTARCHDLRGCRCASVSDETGAPDRSLRTRRRYRSDRARDRAKAHRGTEADVHRR